MTFTSDHHSVTILRRSVAVGLVTASIATAQCICKTCSRVLLHEASRAKFLKRMRHPRGMGALERGNLHKKIVAECKKATTCMHDSCFALNGSVRKVLQSFNKSVSQAVG